MTGHSPSGEISDKTPVQPASKGRTKNGRTDRSSHQKGERAAMSLSPSVRRAIQRSDESVRIVAQRYGISPTTVQKWRKRTHTEDLRHCARARDVTPVTALVARCIMLFRFQTLLPLDDCYHAFKMGVPGLSRTTLHRCLQRYGASSLKGIDGIPTPQQLKEMPIGHFNICVDTIAVAGRRVAKFSAYDWISKVAFARLKGEPSTKAAIEFVQELAAEFPFIYHVKTSDQDIFSGNADFSHACRSLGIEHGMLFCSDNYRSFLAQCTEADCSTISELERRMTHLYGQYNSSCRLKTLGGLSPMKYIDKVMSEYSEPQFLTTGQEIIA